MYWNNNSTKNQINTLKKLYNCNKLLSLCKEKNMDISQLRTIAEYSKMIGTTYEAVRKRVAGNRLKTRRIAGKDLIYLPEVKKDLERIKRKKNDHTD